MNTSDRRVRTAIALSCAFLVGGIASVAAADDVPGITVSETGVVDVMPDTVEMTATVEGKAELAGDAVGKYRSSKQRLIDSVSGLKIKGLTVDGSGVALVSGSTASFMAAIQGQANENKPTEKVAVQEKMTIRISGIDSMTPEELLNALTRVVDVAKDVGVAIGPGPKSMIEMQLGGASPGALATFKLGSVDAARKQAYESAIKQARAKAGELAKLAGVALGDVVSIRETVVPSGDSAGGNPMVAYLAMLGSSASKPSELSSPELHTIPVSVSLSVQFAIATK